MGRNRLGRWTRPRRVTNPARHRERGQLERSRSLGTECLQLRLDRQPSAHANALTGHDGLSTELSPKSRSLATGTSRVSATDGVKSSVSSSTRDALSRRPFLQQPPSGPLYLTVSPFTWRLPRHAVLPIAYTVRGNAWKRQEGTSMRDTNLLLSWEVRHNPWCPIKRNDSVETKHPTLHRFPRTPRSPRRPERDQALLSGNTRVCE